MRTIRASWVELGGGAVAVLLLALCGLAVTSQEIVNDLGRGKGYNKPTPEQRLAAYQRDKVRNGARVAMAARMAAPPPKFDCTEMGWVPPIEDQGNCGSCYGVATADQLTTAFIKGGYQKNDGSFAIRFQYGLDCQNFGGCNGGWGYEVAEWMQKNGFPAEHYVDANGKKVADYPPYEARPRTCREKSGAKRWKPAEIGLCSGSSNRAATVLEIKTCLMQYGVVNIAFNASSAYGSAGSNVVRIKGGANHETTLVGWDDSKNGGKGAWKTRGNWGTGLGDAGYVWFTYDSDLEDPFWMTANALPPPPPDPTPPDPPGPFPPGPVPTVGQMMLAIDRDLKAGTYTWQLVAPGQEIVPAGTRAALNELQELNKRLSELLNRKAEKTEEPPMIEQPKVEKSKVEKKPADTKSVKDAADKLSEAVAVPMAETIRIDDGPRPKFNPGNGARDPKTGKLLKKAG